MKGNPPIPNIILSYKEIFGVPYSDKPLDLIKHINKNELIANFSSSNSRLKPPEKVYYDHSIKKQWDELKLFCGNSEGLFKFYEQKTLAFVTPGKRWTIFNRVSNLFALELILESKELQPLDDFKMTINDWDKLVKFYLCINQEIIQITDNGQGDKRLIAFENLNTKLVPLNQYFIESNPIFSIFRAKKFFEYMEELDLFQGKIVGFFKKELNSTPDFFLHQIFSIINHKQSDNPLLRFVYQPADAETKKILDFFSVPRQGIKSKRLDFLSIKKKPLYVDEHGIYYMLDNQFFLEKSYDLLLNDFWFDYLSNLYTLEEDRDRGFKLYRSTVGKFFESYLNEILSIAFSRFQYPTPKFFNDLKIKTSMGEVELADVYVRHHKKVIIGEAKSGVINAKEKYSGSALEFFKNDPIKFYQDYGLNKLIKFLHYLQDKPLEFDPKFPIGRRIEIFPIIIFYEKAFKTALFPESFAARFKSMVANESFPNFFIHPLCMIHIEDWEYCCSYLAEDSTRVFKLIRANHKQLAFPEPFHLTLAKEGVPFIVPDIVYDYFIELQKIKK